MTNRIAPNGDLPQPSQAVLLSGLHKNYGAVNAVCGIDLCIGKGELVALLGPNGAGKTSTIDIMLGLSRPTLGTAQIFGMPPSNAIRLGLVSAVLQNGGLLKDLTVLETIQYASSLFATSKAPQEVMERAGLAGIANRMVGKCSGGEQQRLRFAMALLPDPTLLVLDEPTQGMDVEGRIDFWEAIRADARRGRTVIFATHYLQEADSYADRIVLMRHGRIVADGSTGSIKRLVSGQIVRAILPEADLSRIGKLPGVESVSINGTVLEIECGDSDGVARYLLNHTGAHNLEISSIGLEEAFLALTGDPSAIDGSNG